MGQPPLSNCECPMCKRERARLRSDGVVKVQLVGGGGWEIDVHRALASARGVPVFEGPTAAERMADKCTAGSPAPGETPKQEVSASPGPPAAAPAQPAAAASPVTAAERAGGVENDTDRTKPIIFISGDAGLGHLVLQQEGADSLDRFMKGREIKDFYVPGGTFLLEFLLSACASQTEHFDAATNLTPSGIASPGPAKYEVRGPYKRNKIKPRNPLAIVDIRSFPRDTTIVQKCLPLRPRSSDSDSSYRVVEGVGFHRGTYIEDLGRVTDDPAEWAKKLATSDWARFRGAPPGVDDNFHNMRWDECGHEVPGGQESEEPFVHVINCEFDHFGAILEHEAPSPSEPVTVTSSDRIASASMINTLEKWRADHAFVLKLKHRGAWNGMKEPWESQIRDAVVRFLLNKGAKEQRRRERTTMVVSAEELRQANVYISNHLSWERTIQSTIQELRIVEHQLNTFLAAQGGRSQCDRWKLLEEAADKFSYSFLLLPRHLVITFGCDGALLLRLNLMWRYETVVGEGSGGDQGSSGVASVHAVRLVIEACHTIIDPRGAEGSHSDLIQGRMRGFDSIVTAAIAHGVMMELLKPVEAGGVAESDGRRSPEVRTETLREALAFGLKAGRYLQVHGYDLYDPGAWNALEAHVVGCDKSPDSNSHRRHLAPYFHASRVVASTWDLVRGWSAQDTQADQAKAQAETLRNCPVLPFDALSSIITHHSILRFDQLPAIGPSMCKIGPDDRVVQQLRDLRRRQDREWRELGFVQVNELPAAMYRQLLRPEEVSNRAKPDQVQASGYGSFDRTWWRLVDAAIPDWLAEALPFPIAQARQSELGSIFDGAPGLTGWERDRLKSLIVAYAALKFGLDVFQPERADRVREKAALSLGAAIDVCASLVAYHSACPVNVCAEKILNDLLPSLLKGLKPEDIKMAFGLGARPAKQGGSPPLLKNVPSGVFPWCVTSEGAGQVVKVLEKAYDANELGLGKRPLSLWIGALPTVEIGKIQSIERREIENYRMLQGTFREYMQRKKETKPLNIGVFGPAGSGKSFAVREIAETIHDPKRLAFLTFNLSQFSSPTDLVDAFEEIADAGLENRTPIVFWDEYDTKLGMQPLGWLAYFLGPMNDGKYFRRERSRALPKAIFVFAGSMFKEYADMHRLDFLARKASQAPTQPEEPCGNFTPSQWRDAKGPDFKSRLTGTLDVLGINESVPAQGLNLRCDPFGHYIRRATTLRFMLRDIHPELFGSKGELRIPANVARGFVELKEYFHGNRSIEQILRMCDFGDTRVFEYSCMPAASQFLLHASPGAFEELAEQMSYYVPRER